jgi:PAS domain S-box-containing protein
MSRLLRPSARKDRPLGAEPGEGLAELAADRSDRPKPLTPLRLRPANAILAACKAILGADAGCVALCAAGAEDLEVVVLDRGRLELGPLGPGAAELPAPLRRLFARALSNRRPVFANDLSKRRPTTPPDHRSVPRNALAAPIVIAGDVAGLLGLIDKGEGFTEADSRLAQVFAELAAAALLESRTVDRLETERTALENELRVGASRLLSVEEQFRTLVENLPDLIARFDPELRYLYVSPAVESITGRAASAFVGRTNQQLGISSELTEAWDAALHRVFTNGRPESVELTLPTPDGRRHFDCRLVPEPGTTQIAVPSVLTVARDVTDRWLAHEAEKNAREVAEALREATVVLTRSLDRESVLVILLDRLRRMVTFDRGRVMLVEEAPRLSVRAVFDGNRAVSVPAETRPVLDANEHPIVRDILIRGAAVLIPDIRTHPGWSLPTEHDVEASWMGVPLFARGSVAGLFELSKREADYFKEEHVKLAEALASQASVAVENAVLFEQMQASTARMRALSRRLVEAQESERRHIALELHDEAGQALVSMRFGLRLLEREIAGGGNVAGRVADLVRTTDDVIEGLHRLAADLRPASLDHVGLDAALRQYARSAGSKQGVAVHFKARGFTRERLPPVVETTLYRLVQEAMTNVVRHARATRVDLLVDRRDDRVLVVVEDDGVGFEPTTVQSEHHFGLLGMRERAEALGGALVVESSPGKGTTIVVEVPSADPDPDR